MTSPTGTLTVSQAIARLEEKGIPVTTQTVRRWIKAGKVRAMRRRSGGQFYVVAEDIESMLQPVEPPGSAA